MIVQVCVGSSCHIRGSEKIIKLLQDYIQAYNFSDDITLAGSFCTGKCNNIGVTIKVNEQIITGITVENFNKFFDEYIIKGINSERTDN